MLPNRLTRYVIGELLNVFVIALVGLSLVMTIFGLAKEALRQGLGVQAVLRLIPYTIPDALRFAVPGTILFAACSVFGRMAASNEVVAVKALGVSPMRMVRPAIMLAFFISLATVWLNDIAVSWGRAGIERVVLTSVEQIAYGMLRARRSYSNPDFSITVKNVDGRKLVLPMICFHPDDETPPVVITAREAELRLRAEEGVLSVILTDGEVTVGDEVSMVFPDTEQRDIMLGDSARKGAGDATNPSSVPMASIGNSITRQRGTVEQLRQTYAAAAAFQMISGELAGFDESDWGLKPKQLERAEYRLHRLRTEPWRRWANGFSCLFFVMVGAPLAMRMRNSDLWTTFAVCFLPILLLYYPLLALGVDRAKSGGLPPYAVWLGNAILAIAGIWHMRKVARH